MNKNQLAVRISTLARFHAEAYQRHHPWVTIDDMQDLAGDATVSVLQRLQDAPENTVTMLLDANRTGAYFAATIRRAAYRMFCSWRTRSIRDAVDVADADIVDTSTHESELRDACEEAREFWIAVRSRLKPGGGADALWETLLTSASLPACLTDREFVRSSRNLFTIALLVAKERYGVAEQRELLRSIMLARLGIDRSGSPGHCRLGYE